MPYWRFKGMAFFCTRTAVRHRFHDLTSRAIAHRFLPHSLGVRAQALKLKFITPETGGRFFRTQIPLKEVMEFIQSRLPASQKGPLRRSIFHQAFIGETISRIYSPIFIRGNVIHDGVLGNPVAPIPDDFVDDVFSYDSLDHGRFTSLATLCPRCGWDLAGETDSVVLLCRQCDSAWEAWKTDLRPLDFSVVSIRDDAIFYLPFWRMHATFEGLGIRSYADLARVANLPRVAKDVWEETEAYFWTPAFKAPPGVFLRLCRGLTLSEPPKDYRDQLPGGPSYPVTLPISEAVESIKVTLADFMTDTDYVLPRLRETQVSVHGHRLIYLPFHLTGNEFIQSQTQCCIHKNELKLGRNL